MNCSAVGRPTGSVPPGTSRNSPPAASTNGPPSGSSPLGGTSPAAGAPTIAGVSWARTAPSSGCASGETTASAMTSAVSTTSTGIAYARQPHVAKNRPTGVCLRRWSRDPGTDRRRPGVDSSGSHGARSGSPCGG